MNQKSDLTLNGPDSWAATLLGAGFFLLAGLQLMLSDIPLDSAIPVGVRTFDWLLLFGLVIPAIGFAAGWARGFPRWCYPYIGSLLVYSLYMMNMHTSLLYYLGYEKQRWGWRAWIPFLLAALIGYLLSRLPERSAAQSKDHPSPILGRGDGGEGGLHEQSASDSPSPAGEIGSAGEGGPSERSVYDNPSPASGFGFGVRAAGVRIFFTRIYHDPTLASYAMFAWMPLIIFIAFDEIARPYSLAFMLLLTALMVTTAILYHRASHGDSRAVILIVGLLLTLVVTEVGMIAYWLPQDGVYLPAALLWGVFIAVVILYPLWLRHLTKPRQKAGTL